jgi:hypothetical protein
MQITMRSSTSVKPPSTGRRLWAGNFIDKRSCQLTASSSQLDDRLGTESWKLEAGSWLRVYWIGVAVAASVAARVGAAPVGSWKIVPAADVENPMLPVVPTVCGTAVP